MRSEPCEGEAHYLYENDPPLKATENAKEPCHCGKVLIAQAVDGFRNQKQFLL